MGRSISFVVEGDVNTQLTVTENSDGTLRFDIKVLGDGMVGDLRGLFFDLDGVDTSLGGLTATSQAEYQGDITDEAYSEAGVDTLGKDANVKGEVTKELGDFDVGIEFGTSGLSADDIQETSFALAWGGGDLTLDMVDLTDFGLRYTSVGDVGGSRNGSLKVGDKSAGVAQNDFLDVDENGSAGLNLLGNDTNGATNTVIGADGFTDVDGNLTADLIIDGKNYGTMTLSPDGSLTATAAGPDVDGLSARETKALSFSYQTLAADGSTATAVATVKVHGVNDGPVIVDAPEGPKEPAPAPGWEGGPRVVAENTDNAQYSDNLLTVLSNGNIVVSTYDWDATTEDNYLIVLSPTGTEISRTAFVDAPYYGGTGGLAPSRQPADVVALADGGFAALWGASDTGGGATDRYMIRMQTFDADGTPRGAEFKLLGDGAGSPYVNSSVPVLMDAVGLDDGTIAIVYRETQEEDGPYFSNYDNKLLVADASGTIVAQMDLEVGAPSSSTQTKVTSAGGGKFLVVWSESYGDLSDPAPAVVQGFAQIFDANGAVSAKQSLSMDQAGAYDIVQLAGGGFVVVRGNNSSSSYRMTVELLDENAASLGPATVVAPGDDHFRFADPEVVALDNGGFAVAWTDDALTGVRQTFVQCFNADGSVLGDPFAVDLPHTPSGGYDAEIGISATGTLTVLWQELGDDPVYGGVDFLVQSFVLPGGSAATSGAVTELPDGAPSENLADLTATGTIAFEDADLTDTHTATAVAQGAGYLGTLTLGAPTTTPTTTAGTVDWTFTVNDADLDALNAGNVLTQVYDVTIDDGNGGTAVTSVTVTIGGADDAPETFGVVIAGQDPGDSDVGNEVNSAGDVNGDGIDDFLIGAPGGDPNGVSNAGEVYVIFGGTDLDTIIDLGTLDGTDGFVINGIANGDYAGFFVSGAGDVNGDGTDDIMVGAEYGGESYVIFGRDTATAGNFPASFDFSSLDGTNGFVMSGGSRPTRVANAGDVNGDGIDDMLVGDWTASRGYVVFGRDTSADGDFAASIDLLSLDGTDGFIFQGTGASGAGIDGAGDINGDGIDDIVVNSPLSSIGGGYLSGGVFVVYGKDIAAEGDFAATLNYTDLDGANGFAIPGLAAGDRLALAGSAGDVNGDGIDDLLLGAYQSDVNGTDSGQAYIVFGQDTATSGDFPASFDLSTLDGTNGFTMDGIGSNDWAGLRGSAAGDQNGDGIDDFVFSATEADASAGEVYVVFGLDTATEGDFAANLDLSALDGSNGYVIRGIDAVDRAGRALDATADVNGDGINDIIVHAPNADPDGRASAGETYAVYGGSANLDAFDAADGLADGSIELGLILGDTLLF